MSSSCQLQLGFFEEGCQKLFLVNLGNQVVDEIEKSQHTLNTIDCVSFLSKYRLIWWSTEGNSVIVLNTSPKYCVETEFEMVDQKIFQDNGGFFQMVFRDGDVSWTVIPSMSNDCDEEKRRKSDYMFGVWQESANWRQFLYLGLECNSCKALRSASCFEKEAHFASDQDKTTTDEETEEEIEDEAPSRNSHENQMSHDFQSDPSTRNMTLQKNTVFDVAGCSRDTLYRICDSGCGEIRVSYLEEDEFDKSCIFSPQRSYLLKENVSVTHVFPLYLVNSFNILILLSDLSAKLFYGGKLSSCNYPNVEAFLWPYSFGGEEIYWSAWDPIEKRIFFTCNENFGFNCAARPKIKMSSSRQKLLCFIEKRQQTIFYANLVEESFMKIEKCVHKLESIDCVSLLSGNGIILWSIKSKLIVFLNKASTKAVFEVVAQKSFQNDNFFQLEIPCEDRFMYTALPFVRDDCNEERNPSDCMFAVWKEYTYWRKFLQLGLDCSAMADETQIETCSVIKFLSDV